MCVGFIRYKAQPVPTFVFLLISITYQFYNLKNVLPVCYLRLQVCYFCYFCNATGYASAMRSVATGRHRVLMQTSPIMFPRAKPVQESCQL